MDLIFEPVNWKNGAPRGAQKNQLATWKTTCEEQHSTSFWESKISWVLFSGSFPFDELTWDPGVYHPKLEQRKCWFNKITHNHLPSFWALVWLCFSCSFCLLQTLKFEAANEKKRAPRGARKNRLVTTTKAEKEESKKSKRVCLLTISIVSCFLVVFRDVCFVLAIMCPVSLDFPFYIPHSQSLLIFSWQLFFMTNGTLLLDWFLEIWWRTSMTQSMLPLTHISAPILGPLFREASGSFKWWHAFLFILSLASLTSALTYD